MAQATRKKPRQARITFKFQRGLREVGLWVCVTLACYLFLALLTYNPADPGWLQTAPAGRYSNVGGVIGAYFTDITFHFFGYLGYFIPVLLIYGGWLLYLDDETQENNTFHPANLALSIVGLLITFAAGAGLATLQAIKPDWCAAPVYHGVSSCGAGGVLGELIGIKLVWTLGYAGATLFLFGLVFAGMTLFTGISWTKLVEWLGRATCQSSDKWEKYLQRFVSWVLEANQQREARRSSEAATSAAVDDKEAHHSYQVESRIEPRIEPTFTRIEPSFGDIREEINLTTVPEAAVRVTAALLPPVEPEVLPPLPQPAAISRKPHVEQQIPAPAPVVVTIPPLVAAIPIPELIQEPTIPLPSIVQHIIDEDNGNVAAINVTMPPLPSVPDDPVVRMALNYVPLPPLTPPAAPPAAPPTPTPPPPVLSKPSPPPSKPSTPPLVSKPTATSSSRSTSTVVAPRTLAAAPLPQRAELPLDVAPPSLGLLDTTAIEHPHSPEFLEQLSRMVEARLSDFNVEVQVVGVQPGPVITRFELQPAPGVKVSQITNLSKDIARSLSVISVRVVEVIPGRPTVGLEIPNEHRAIVPLGEVLRSPEYDQCTHVLPLTLGKDIGGKPVVVDLQRMPHLLVAGTTGSGKSVAMNAMVLSLLYKLQPSQARLIMVDPKMLELSIYQGIPHLLAPVVTDMKEAANALRWCVAEMDQRYRLMASLGVRNIAGFNRKVSDALSDELPLTDPLRSNETDPIALSMLPYIVVLIDELADLMMVVGKKVEELIARLAQKARAAGIHLIIATQRPSVDVITGLIKANIPTRIAFQVSSRIDSRTILDQQGAETLLGHGDMLYLPPGSGVPIRVHGAFVSDQEVHRVAEDLKARGAPNYINDVLHGGTTENESGGGDTEVDPEDDPLFEEALRIVTETRRASVSGIQRRLKIGYNRAARLVEVMERCGVVGPLQSNGSREVLKPAPVEPTTHE